MRYIETSLASGQITESSSRSSGSYWARQELRKYRLLYSREGDDDPFCSYCKSEIESELHLYVNCGQMQYFWECAAKWYNMLIGVNPPLGLKVYRLFGQEKERPDDLNNIFYRSVRYAIFISRKYALGPTLESFEELLLDDRMLQEMTRHQLTMMLKMALVVLDPCVSCEAH